MPLIKMYTVPGALKKAAPSANALFAPLKDIWAVPDHVLKIMSLEPTDATALRDETLYVDVRAKARPERTPEAVQAKMEAMAKLFKEHGHTANIRVELYEPSLQSSYMASD